MKKYFIISVVSLCTFGAMNMALAQAEPMLYTSMSANTGACVMLTSSSLKVGATNATTGGEFSSLQNFLMSKGFLSGSATGYYGKMTEDAVKAYQASTGLTQTGSVGPLTRAAITNATCSLSYNGGAPASAATEVCTMEYRTCADGSAMPRGPGCGWHPEQCPGELGSQSITYFSDVIYDANDQAIAVGSMGGANLVAADTSRPAPQVLGASASCVAIPTNMFRGAESSSVTMLQNFLISKGLLSGNATGFYGDMTVAAVKRYQTSVGLKDSGMVYELTRQAIKNETCNAQ